MLELLFQRDERLLSFLALRYLWFARRQRCYDDRAPHLGHRFHELLKERNGLARQRRVADRQGCGPDALVSQLVQQDQTRRRLPQDFGEDALGHSLRPVVRLVPLIQRLATQLQRHFPPQPPSMHPLGRLPPAWRRRTRS